MVKKNLLPFLEWLTSVKPNASVNRQYAVMLARFLAIVITIHIIFILGQIAVNILDTTVLIFTNLSTFLLSETFFVGMWLLNRQGYSKVASHLTFTVTIVAMSLFPPPEYSLLAFTAFIIDIILASFILDPLFAFLYGAFSALGFIFARFSQGEGIVYFLTGILILSAFSFISYSVASQLKNSTQRLQFLHAIDHAILTAESPERIAAVVLEYLQRLIPSKYARITTTRLGSPRKTLLATWANGEAHSGSQGLDSKSSAVLENIFDSLQPEKKLRKDEIQFESVEINYSNQSEMKLTVMRTPLVIGKSRIGEISLGLKKKKRISPEQIETVKEVADQLAIAIRQFQLYEASQQRSKELATLLSASRVLASTLEMEAVLQISIESAVNAINLETGAIYVLEEGALYLGATTPPLDPNLPDEFRRAPLTDHPHIQKSLALGTPVILSDTNTEELTPAERAICEARGLRSILYVPLVTADQAVGVLILGSIEKLREFSKSDLDLSSTLANQIALTVTNAYLYRSVNRANVKLLQAYNKTIEGWSQALDMRDHETESHTLRVTDLTLKLATKLMEITEDELAHIYRGALLHDVGKIGVPDHILLKPGELTEEEWEIMRMHPVNAFNLLNPIEFLHPALDIPYCHHEAWDGSGYPRGLKGEEIPLSARIFTVVDVFDALTSDRPYRKKWIQEEAIRYIQEQAGKKFDPRVVEAFMKEVGK